MRPGMMEDKAIRVTGKPVGLRCKLNQWLALVAEGRSRCTRLRLVVVVVRAVVLVIVKLRPHLFFQVVLGFVNLLLQAVAGIVADEATLGALWWDLGDGFFINLAEIL
jgi:hypothetical protein